MRPQEAGSQGDFRAESLHASLADAFQDRRETGAGVLQRTLGGQSVAPVEEEEEGGWSRKELMRHVALCPPLWLHELLQ